MTTLHLSKITHLSRRQLGRGQKQRVTMPPFTTSTPKTTVNHSNNQMPSELGKLTEMFFRGVQLPLALVVALLTNGVNRV